MRNCNLARCCCVCLCHVLTDDSSSGTEVVSDVDTWLTARLPKLLLQDELDTDITDDALNDWCDTFTMRLNSVALSTKMFTVVDAESKAMCFKLVRVLQLLTVLVYATVFSDHSCLFNRVRTKSLQAL